MLEALKGHETIGIIICNSDDIVVEANNALTRLVGLEPREFIGRTAESFWDELIGKRPSAHEENRTALFFQNRLKGENAGPFVFALREDRLPARCWLRCESVPTKDDEGREVRVESFVDVTAEMVLQSSRNFHQKAMDYVGETIIITDADGVIRYVNPAFTRMMGYSPLEVLGRPVSILENGDRDPELIEEMWTTLRSGETWRGVFCNKTKDDNSILVDSTVSPVRNSLGEVVEFVAVQRDVTKDKAMEKHLRTVQKMQAVGTLAGGIAHDFNNVVHVVSGYAQLALQRLENTDKLEKYLRMVLKACRRADRLVGQILTFCRQREQPFKPLFLSSTIRETVRLLRSTLPSSIEIRFEIQQDVDCKESCVSREEGVVESHVFSDAVMGDPTQLHQVVMNLCTNASHAMEDKGGNLVVSVQSVEIEDPIKDETPNLEKGRYVRLTVKDDGAGISPQVLDRIFEPYFTTKEKDKGTGLGLTIVHGIVSNHGGDIVVKSKVGEGSRFDVFFPAAVDVTPEEDLTPVMGEWQGGGRRLLCVDDEPSALRVVEEMLRELGYEVCSAVGGMEALEVFKKEPHSFDGVITDKVMPNIDGLELARYFKRVRPNMPVILCTGYADDLSEKELDDIGVFDFLHKPFAADQLGCTLKEAFSNKPLYVSDDN